jgi:uncharacterized iron-regulated membrane protein
VRDKNALTPDEAARIALASIPKSRVLQVQLPPMPDGVYMVTLVPKLAGDGAPQISTFVGPGPEILDLVDPRTYAAGKQALMWLRVMHLRPGARRSVARHSRSSPDCCRCCSAITGVSMWWLKGAQRRAVPDALPQPAE